MAAYYCICKDGQSETALQKAIDYACGNGADCTAILQNGGCYQPNTVKAHCDYAVNSYFQRKAQASGTCDFTGAATQAGALPTTVASTCQYQATPSIYDNGVASLSMNMLLTNVLAGLVLIKLMLH
ncbi:hypothetical protein ACFE04_022511 [Oxalis oulophora]